MSIIVTMDNFSNSELTKESFNTDLAESVSMASSPAKTISAGGDTSASTYENNSLLDLIGTGAAQFSIVYKDSKSGMLFGINVNYSGSIAGFHLTGDNSPFSWSYLFSEDSNAWTSVGDPSGNIQTKTTNGFSLSIAPDLSDGDDISITLTINGQ